MPIDIGSVAIGALCIIALMAGFVGYLFRGHRIDATGIKVVSTRPTMIVSTSAEPYVMTYGGKEAPKPEDFYEMAKERDPE